MNDEKKKILKIVRSLIISNPQNGMRVKQLLSDFKTFEGSDIPPFEHRTAVEFLRASNEFVIENVRGEWFIYANATGESSHISKLVSEQSKPRAKRTPPKANRSHHSVYKEMPNHRSSTFYSTRQIGQNISTHQPRYQNKSGQITAMRKNEVDIIHKKAPTIEFSFDQLKSQQKASNDEQLQRQAPTIEFSFEQLMSQQQQSNDESDNVPSNKLLQLEQTENVNGNNWFAKDVTTTTPILPTYRESHEDRIGVIDESNEINNNEEGDSAIEHKQLKKLELPWDDKYWSLFITCCISTTEIWGKLFGKHCGLDPLAFDFQKDLMSNKKIASVFNVGQIYLTIVCGFGYRIRLVNVDHSKNQILCFFIDEGDQRWLAMDEIYNCHSKFMDSPPQAICFTLFGLEDFPIDNGITRKHLESVLLNQTLTGRIVTKREEFILSNESNDCKPVIQVVFHDDNLINLHPKIVRHIYNDIPVAELVALKLTAVIITHIADDGAIFCQLQRNCVDYVNKLIKEFLRQTLNKPPEKIATISYANLFVVNDEETGCLYRAKVIEELDEARRMFFIDCGQVKTIPLSNMYHVEPSNQEIIKIPPQAIRTKLSGMSNIPENLVSRLRNTFRVNKRAYVKKVDGNPFVSEIKLYFDAESFMVCVNDSFGLENERNRIIDTIDGTYSQNNLSLQRVADAKISTQFDNLSIDGGNCSQTSLTSITKSTIKTFQPPKLNSCFEVVVVQTETPSNFVIKPIKFMAEWYEQMKTLQNHCNETPETVPVDMIDESEPYACLKSNGYWYRAFIKFHRTKMFAFFCDIADIDNINDPKTIKYLPDEYRDIPKLAMTAKLSGIAPINKNWEMDDNIQFHRITKGKKFGALVSKITNEGDKDDSYVLEIKLMYKSQCINDLFVDSGRAIRM